MTEKIIEKSVNLEKSEILEDREIVELITVGDLLRDCVLIKKYAFEKNDERIYLCADNIERNLHKVRYGNARLEHEW